MRLLTSIILRTTQRDRVCRQEMNIVSKVAGYPLRTRGSRTPIDKLYASESRACILIIDHLATIAALLCAHWCFTERLAALASPHVLRSGPLSSWGSSSPLRTLLPLQRCPFAVSALLTASQPTLLQDSRRAVVRWIAIIVVSGKLCGKETFLIR
jgi:hypothetical protein